MASSKEERVQQRVRVGLTGLACVFLLVMLAAVFLRAAGGGTADLAVNEAAATANGATPSEPLAQLGVTPGNGPVTPPPAARTPPRTR